MNDVHQHCARCWAPFTLYMYQKNRKRLTMKEFIVLFQIRTIRTIEMILMFKQIIGKLAETGLRVSKT